MFELGDKLNLWLTQPSRWASPVIVILYARQSHVIAPKSGANHHRRSIHVSTAVRRQVVFQSYRFNTLLKHRIGNNIPKDKEFLLLCLKTLFAPVPTWRFRSKGTQKSDDYFGVKPPKKSSNINKKGRKIGSRVSIFRSIATQLP